jgi:hypothetical protein
MRGRSSNNQIVQVMMVTRKKEGLSRTDATFRKEERAREGTQAWQEYEAEARAIEERTARLRALRLAKEADGNKKPVQPVEPTRKQPVEATRKKRAVRSGSGA